VAYAIGDQRGQVRPDDRGSRTRGAAEGLGERPMHGGAVVVADADHARLEGRYGGRHGSDERAPRPSRVVDTTRPWNNPDWLPCRDGKARPVEPGLLPLAHGAPARVGRLRAYGNAIVPQVAAAFVRAFMEVSA
jgi:DNA (cytosine-5)-methyltransferase 1